MPLCRRAEGHGEQRETAAVTTPVLILLAVPLGALGVGMIWVLITRIREIDKGEEDDLSNY